MTTRPAAIKTIIREIGGGTFEQDEQGQNFLRTSRQEKLYRVNVLAIVPSIEKNGNITTLWLDDGSGKIAVRFFEESTLVNSFQAGDVLLIIGKVRSYNHEKYLAAEIARKVSPSWLKVRKRELAEQFEHSLNLIPHPGMMVETISSERTEIRAGDVSEEKLRQLITELDKGSGVLIEDIVEHSALPETEAQLKKMLEQGDIFQNLPGRVKIL